MEGNELRCYVFVNLALSSIQKGVQGNHACVEVGVQSNYSDMYRDWAKNHKTLIYLQGGFHGVLEEQYKEFKRLCDKLDIPNAGFYEDEETMNCMFTSFAGVIPSAIFDIELPILDSDDNVIGEANQSHGNMTFDIDVNRKLYPDEELALFLSRFRLAV